MSIWDYFNGSASPEQNAGLTGFASALNGALGDGRRPVGFGQILSAGAQGMQQGRDQYGEQQQQQAIQALKLRAMQGDVEAQDRLQQEQMALQQAAQSAVGPDGQFNQEQFLRTLRSTNALKAIELEQKMAKAGPEFSTTPQTGLGPDGKPFQYLIAKNGEMKRLDGVLPRDELKLANLGGKDVAYNPFALQDGQTFQRTMTPGETASNGIARANLGLSQQRLALERQNAGKPVYNAEAGGFILPPSATNPGGKIIPLAGTGGGKMTEDQSKATGWVVQAENAYNNMKKVAFDKEGKLTSAARPGAADALASVPFLGAAGNALRSPDRQKFTQAASSLSEALLRAATGAGVNRDEAAQKIAEITPQFGDSEEVVQQKFAAVPLYLDSLKVRAGPGAKKAAGVLAGPAPAGGGWSIKKVGE